MIIGTTTQFIKLGTNETVMSISKVHLTTITGKEITQKVGTEYVPCR